MSTWVRFLHAFLIMPKLLFTAGPLVWRVASRNVWRNPRRTGVVVTAVAIGIAGVVLTMAVNYGMVVQMVETAIETELGHMQIHGQGFDQNPDITVRLIDGGRAGTAVLRDVSGVTTWARRVRGEGFLASPRSSAGVRVVGIEPERGGTDAHPAVDLCHEPRINLQNLPGQIKRWNPGIGHGREAKLQGSHKTAAVVAERSDNGSIAPRRLRIELR